MEPASTHSGTIEPASDRPPPTNPTSFRPTSTYQPIVHCLLLGHMAFLGQVRLLAQVGVLGHIRLLGRVGEFWNRIEFFPKARGRVRVGVSPMVVEHCATPDFSFTPALSLKVQGESKIPVTVLGAIARLLLLDHCSFLLPIFALGSRLPYYCLCNLGIEPWNRAVVHRGQASGVTSTHGRILVARMFLRRAAPYAALSQALGDGPRPRRSMVKPILGCNYGA